MGTQWSNKRSLSAAPRHLDSLEEFQPGLKFPYCTHETTHHRTQKENFPQGVRCILSCCIVCLGPRKLEALQCCNEKDILACQIYSTAITTYQNMFLHARSSEAQLFDCQGSRKATSIPKNSWPLCSKLLSWKHATTIQGYHPWASIVCNRRTPQRSSQWIIGSMWVWVTE